MKVLVVGRFYDEGVATFIAEGLEDLGHSVSKFDPGPGLIKFGGRTAFYWNRVSSKVHQSIRSAARIVGLDNDIGAIREAIQKSGPVDLVLSTHDFLTPQCAALIKNLTKAPLVLWYPDPIWSFQRHMFLNAPYDFIFFKDPYLVDIFKRKLAICTHYLPECFSPWSLGKLSAVKPEVKYETDICTAGNLYSYRVAFFRNLVDQDVKIWGLPAPLWMDVKSIKPMIQNRFVAHSEKVAAFRGAKIVLNNLNPAEIWGTNVRTFEICGSGGFQLVDWRPGLSQLFNLDRELVAFDDVDDLRTKIHHYLAEPGERAEIAAAGQARAEREHTYTLRLSLLLDTVAGRAKGYPCPRVKISDISFQ